MLVVDDILFFPFKSILSVFQEIYQAAKQEQAGDEQGVRTELAELYMMLETRRITEEEFNAREIELLDRLERFESRDTHAEDEPESGGG
jgi:hypothetical protein